MNRLKHPVIKTERQFLSTIDTSMMVEFSTIIRDIHSNFKDYNYRKLEDVEKGYSFWCKKSLFTYKLIQDKNDFIIEKGRIDILKSLDSIRSPIDYKLESTKISLPQDKFEHYFGSVADLFKEILTRIDEKKDQVMSSDTEMNTTVEYLKSLSLDGFRLTEDKSSFVRFLEEGEEEQRLYFVVRDGWFTLFIYRYPIVRGEEILTYRVQVSELLKRKELSSFVTSLRQLINENPDYQVDVKAIME